MCKSLASPQIELAFHAKALELYTRAYNQVSAIEEEEDLEVSEPRIYVCCSL